MAHWAQQVDSGTFEMFDYGTQGNMQHYNQPTPPQYVLQNFPTSLPVAVFMGGEDYLADPTDVEQLLGLLPFPPFVHNEPEYRNVNERIDKSKRLLSPISVTANVLMSMVESMGRFVLIIFSC